jgi:hypothetical protein
MANWVAAYASGVAQACRRTPKGGDGAAPTTRSAVWAIGDKVCSSRLKSPKPIGETHAVVMGLRQVAVFCTASDKAVTANAQSTALVLFRDAEGLSAIPHRRCSRRPKFRHRPSHEADTIRSLRRDEWDRLGKIAVFQGTRPLRPERASRTKLRTHQFDPLPPFPISPVRADNTRKLP